MKNSAWQTTICWHLKYIRCIYCKVWISHLYKCGYTTLYFWVERKTNSWDNKITKKTLKWKSYSRQCTKFRVAYLMYFGSLWIGGERNKFTTTFLLLPHRTLSITNKTQIQILNFNFEIVSNSPRHKTEEGN